MQLSLNYYPQHNRPHQLTNCLQSHAGLQYPSDHFEVIVMDDCNNTPPETVVSQFNNKMNVKLIIQFNAGQVAARNTGAAQAKGKFLAFTDDECISAYHRLQALALRFTGGRLLSKTQIRFDNEVY